MTRLIPVSKYIYFRAGIHFFQPFFFFMQLHKNRAVQIVLLSFMVFYNIVIGFNSDAITLIITLILLILIPFAAAIKDREGWNDFFSVLILMIFPIHSYFLFNALHSNLLYEFRINVLLFLWIPYLFQSIIVTNYLIVYLKDYYRKYSFYRITSLTIFNHGVALFSLIIISINAFQYLSDRSKLNDLIATEIKLESAKVSDSSGPFFNYFANDYTMKVEPKGLKAFLLPIRERIIMEYQGDLFESNYIEKKAFSNEILFKSPKDTFMIEIIQSFERQ